MNDSLSTQYDTVTTETITKYNSKGKCSTIYIYLTEINGNVDSICQKMSGDVFNDKISLFLDGEKYLQSINYKYINDVNNQNRIQKESIVSDVTESEIIYEYDSITGSLNFIEKIIYTINYKEQKTFIFNQNNHIGKNSLKIYFNNEELVTEQNYVLNDRFWPIYVKAENFRSNSNKELEKVNTISFKFVYEVYN